MQNIIKPVLCFAYIFPITIIISFRYLTVSSTITCSQKCLESLLELFLWDSLLCPSKSFALIEYYLHFYPFCIFCFSPILQSLQTCLMVIYIPSGLFKCGFAERILTISNRILLCWLSCINCSWCRAKGRRWFAKCRTKTTQNCILYVLKTWCI